MLLAIGTFSDLGLSAAWFYTVLYTFVVLSIFLGLFVLRRATGDLLQTVSEFKFVTRSAPVSSAIMALSFFSLAGVPPLMGFFTKLFVLKALLSTNNIFLVVVVVAFSTVALYIIFVS